MLRTLLFTPALLLAATTAFAQQTARTDPGCGRDASRFCRAVLDQGDMAVLACLQQNRAKLSKTCAKVLADNGR